MFIKSLPNKQFRAVKKRKNSDTILSENFIQNLLNDTFDKIIWNFWLVYQFITLLMQQLGRVLLLGASILIASES